MFLSTLWSALSSPLVTGIVGTALVVVVLGVLCKLYAVFTEGHYVCRKNLKGQVAIVTGSNVGLGLATARELAAAGARVILACRNESKAIAARDSIIASITKTGGSADVVFRRLDLASLRSVREFAAKVIAEEQRLDILINNAGLLTPAQHEVTEDGYEISIQSNHLGHFLLTNLLLDLLKASAPSRVVNVGSCGQWFGYVNLKRPLDFTNYTFPLLNYCSTKVLNMLFTVELAKRLQGSGVIVNCVHPGFVHSNFGAVDSSFQAKVFTSVLRTYGKTVESGAMPILHVATSDDVTTSGAYFADCHVATAPFWATDARLAAKLWKVSERMTAPRSAPDTAVG